MKKIVSSAVMIMLLYGCSTCSHHTPSDEDRTRVYSKAEVILSDFSKKIIGYYAGQNRMVPEDFDEKQFVGVLEQIYPDQSKVDFIKKDFTIKARHIENGYSVVLCDPKTNDKIMEDAASSSCSLNYVEIRYWDRKDKIPCSFESNLSQYCK